MLNAMGAVYLELLLVLVMISSMSVSYQCSNRSGQIFLAHPVFRCRCCRRKKFEHVLTQCGYGEYCFTMSQFLQAVD